MTTRLITIGSGILVGVAVVLLLLRPSLASIYAGDPFIYPAHIGILARPPLVLLMLILWGLWVFGRHLWQPLQAVRPLAMILLSAACCIFSLLTPLLAVTQIAEHMQSVRTPQHTYHLFYQYDQPLDQTCDHVLVRCDAAGIRCEYVNHWQVAPVCLGNQASLTLRRTDAAGVSLTQNGRRIFSSDS